MSVLSQGLQPRRGPPAWRVAVELCSSMRFAIALLTLICIAAVIGTVLPQGQSPVSYIDRFGPFWAPLFDAAGLYAVYSAWWFLAVLALLVASTSLCIYRTAPRLLADWRSFKHDIRIQSLRSFGQQASAEAGQDADVQAQALAQALSARGWRVRTRERALQPVQTGAPEAAGPGSGWLVAAQKGGARKLGYVATHGAIVLICVGGLFDGDLAVRAAMAFKGVSAYGGGGLVAQVPATHRLSESTPSFRGTIAVAEGTQSSTALLNRPDGVVLQPLPFAIELRRFIVDYYPTGMPKLFASEVVFHDRATGEQRAERIEVNHPAAWRGVQVFQSSFEDGGSALALRAQPFDRARDGFDIAATVGGQQAFPHAKANSNAEAAGGNGVPAAPPPWTLEVTGLRVMNVEPVVPQPRPPSGGRNDPAGRVDGDAPVDVRAVDTSRLGGIGLPLGAAARPDAAQRMRNIGPSVAYRLRDAEGQARDYISYMQPVDLGDGQQVYLHGVRPPDGSDFVYLRLPADVLPPVPSGAVDELRNPRPRHEWPDGQQDFWRLWQALADPALRRAAVSRYAQQAAAERGGAAVHELEASAARVLAVFAGEQGRPEPPAPAAGIGSGGGLQAVSALIERQVPMAQRAQATPLLVRMLQGVLYQLLQVARQADGAAAAPPGDGGAAGPQAVDTYLRLAVLALNDAMLYPAPAVLTLQSFEPVQASIFQVTRTPGRGLVYLGCLLLVAGIFAMLYVRDRRLWAWVVPGAEGGSRVTLAYAANRRSFESDREFEALVPELLGPPREAVHPAT